MASLSNIQNKLQVKVFNKLGSTVTVNYLTTSTDPDYDDVVTTATVSSSYTAVPFMTFLKLKHIIPLE